MSPAEAGYQKLPNASRGAEAPHYPGGTTLIAVPNTALDDVLLAHGHVRQVPQNVQQRHVRLLDAMNAEAGHREAVIRDFGQPPAILARKRDRQQAFVACCLQRVNQVGRLPAGRDRQRHVVLFAPELDLVDEDAREILVVGDRRHHRNLADQIERGKRAPLLNDGVNELDGDMLGVAGAAAVAHHPQPPAARKTLRHLLAQLTDLVRVMLEEFALNLYRFLALTHDLVMPVLGRYGRRIYGDRAHSSSNISDSPRRHGEHEDWI